MAGAMAGRRDQRHFIGEAMIARDQIDAAGIDQIIASGTATAGMVAKLASCRTALLEGVHSVRIIDGRTLDATHGVDEAAGTTLTLAVPA